MGGIIKPLNYLHENVNGTLKLLYQYLPTGFTSWSVQPTANNPDGKYISHHIDEITNNGNTVKAHTTSQSALMYSSIVSSEFYALAGTIITIKDTTSEYTGNIVGRAGYRFYNHSTNTLVKFVIEGVPYPKSTLLTGIIKDEEMDNINTNNMAANTLYYFNSDTFSITIPESGYYHISYYFQSAASNTYPRYLTTTISFS